MYIQGEGIEIWRQGNVQDLFSKLYIIHGHEIPYNWMSKTRGPDGNEKPLGLDGVTILKTNGGSTI